MSRPGPFADVTVVEIGQFVVVPFCAQLLADGGARVIKVEPLEGDAYRRNGDLDNGESRQFLIKNRGKESVSIGLGTPQGDAMLRRLLSKADVVLINMSPAAVARRGLGYQEVRSLNPAVIYGAVTAFGTAGPEAALPGMDVVVQARSGLLAGLGAQRGGVPHHSEVQAADYAASLLLLSGVAAALYVRERTGQGQRVDVSLLAAAMTSQNNALRHVHGLDGWRHEFIEQELPRLRREGATVEAIDAARDAMRPDPPTHTAHYRVFRTADGWIALGAGSPALRARLFELLGIDVDPDDAGQVRGAVGEALVSKPSAEWVSLLRDRGVPVSEVRHIDELLFDPHAEAEGLVADFVHDKVGAYRGLGVPLRMSDTPFEAGSPSPPFAAHTRSVLAELGYDDRQIEELSAAGVVAAPRSHDADDPATEWTTCDESREG